MTGFLVVIFILCWLNFWVAFSTTRDYSMIFASLDEDARKLLLDDYPFLSWLTRKIGKRMRNHAAL